MTIAIHFRPHRRRLRIVAMVWATGALFIGNSARARSMEVFSCEPSTQRATIAASLDGKPVTEFEITIYRSGGKSARALASSPNATLMLPRLHPATYIFYVQSTNNFGGFLCLELWAKKSDAKNSFSVALRPLPPHEPTIHELLAAKDVVLDRSRVFAGVVQDPSRAGVSGVSIQVFQKDRGGKKPVKVLKSDKDGSFRAKLPDGVYVASFQTPGFQTLVMAFEIKSNNPDADMRPTLKLGAMSE
jgi:hypothetical protein